MKTFAPKTLRAGAQLSLAATLAAVGLVGCDKAHEEPVPTPATVVMPATPAPTLDAAASAPSPTLLGSASTAPAVTLPAPSGLGSGDDMRPGISTGTTPMRGGTVSVIPSTTTTTTTTTTQAPATAPVAAAPTAPATAGTAPPAPPEGLLPLPSARASEAGAIGPPVSASSSSDDQPPSVPPGSKR